jgi:hypothetical protein
MLMQVRISLHCLVNIKHFVTVIVVAVAAVLVVVVVMSP